LLYVTVEAVKYDLKRKNEKAGKRASASAKNLHEQ
jgi:hypothetical protein